MFVFEKEQQITQAASTGTPTYFFFYNLQIEKLF